MQVQRCPECGIRLKTNYCDVCMKKVPFSGAKMPGRYTDGSSAHRDEGHECISFDVPKKKQKPARPAKTAKVNTQKVKASAIIIAVLSLVSTLFGIIGDLIPDEPDYRYEDFIEVGEIGTENVPAIETVELYNDGAIIVTADFAALYYDDYTVFMTVMNESDSDIIVSTDLLSVNGYMHSSSLYAEADAGETVQESLQLYTWELDQACIDEVAEIAFHLNIYDQHDFSDIARSELITIETEIADTYEQPEFVDGWELYRDEDMVVRLVSTALYSNDCELLLHMENLSSQTIGVSVPDSAINGKPVDGSLWTMLRPGTKVLATVWLYDTEDISLDQFEEISLDLSLEYMKDWYVDSTRITNITFNPNTL